MIAASAVARATASLGVDVAALKDLLAEMPQGVTVITTLNERGEPVGATLSAVMPLSLDPPMMVAAFDRKSGTLANLTTEGQPFLIHLLGAGQEPLAYTFSGKGASEKFRGIEWSSDLLGLPKLPSCPGTIFCRVAQLLPAGDHVLVFGSIDAFEHTADAIPLLYHRRKLRPAMVMESA